ncbi:MAG: hypothetical protein AAFX41_03815 [Bacteroidota bacterium]
MHTLVLDLHGGLPGLGVAELVLYRPRAAGTLAWVHGGVLRQLSDAELGRTADDVRTHLTRHQVGPWMLLPLLDLPRGGDPLDGSTLTDQLDRLHRFVLEPLAERGLKPSRTVAITLDGLDRDHRGVPTDPAARLRWKLDTFGMARVDRDIDDVLGAPQRAALNAIVAEHPALLDATEVEAIAEHWRVPERPPGVRLDQRLATLTPELRAEFDAARTAVMDATEAALHLDEPQEAEASKGQRSRFIRRRPREALRDRFAEDLDALETVASWQAFDPAAALRLGARRLLSMEAVATHTTVVRLRLTRQPVPALQRSLLHLAYAIVAFAEMGHRPELVKRRQRYAATVDIDESGLAAAVELYRQRLERAHRDVRQRLDEPLVDTVPLVRDPDCGCTRALDVRGRFEEVDRWMRVGPVRGTDDLRWDSWANSVGTDLRATEAEADAHIAACVRSDAARFPVPQPHRLTQPIETLARTESDALDAKQRTLFSAVVPTSSADWNEQTWAEAVAPRLYSRPLGRVVGLWICVGAVLFALPYLAESLTSTVPFAQERAWWLGGLIGAGIAPALGVLVGRWMKLRRTWRAAAHDAKEAFAAVQSRYRLRKDRLAQGCELRAARQRVRALRAAEGDAGHQRLRLRHHATQLQHHLALATALRDRTPRASVSASTPAQLASNPGDRLDLALPPYRNTVYQLTHRPGLSSPPVRLLVNRSEHELAAAELVGLAALTLDAE